MSKKITIEFDDINLSELENIEINFKDKNVKTTTESRWNDDTHYSVTTMIPTKGEIR